MIIAKQSVEWLRQQVIERLEQARRADTGERWEADKHYDALYLLDMRPSAGPVDSAADLHEASLGMKDLHDFENPRFLWACVFQTCHIALNDPQDVIARCEAELAILAGIEMMDEGVGDYLLPRLASGYRHRDGYAQHWEEV